jgi:hypothetical protein
MLTAVKKCVFILEVPGNFNWKEYTRLIIGTRAAKINSDALIPYTYSL